MLKRFMMAAGVLVFMLYSHSSIFAESRDIEVFDTIQGKVVVTASLSKELQQEAASFLHHTTDVYRDVSPIPSEGYMVRVPLDPPVEINNQWVNDLIDEVVILFSTEDDPYLLVFDQENRAHFFTFKGDATGFLGHVLREAQ